MYLLGLVLVFTLYSIIPVLIIKDESLLGFGQNTYWEQDLDITQSKLEFEPSLIKGENFNIAEVHTVYNLNRYKMTIVELSGKDLEYFYFKQNPPKISDLAMRNNCEVAINASYFSGTKLSATHVGLLSIWGRQHVPIGSENQLTHAAVFYKQSKTVRFFDANSYKSSVQNDVIEFQTGPLVLDDGEVQKSFVNNSVNGTTRHKRLLLATDETNRIFIIVVREKVNLIELANYLRSLNVFGKELDVINLDGGKSVALWDRYYPEVNYNSNDRLPLVICVK